MPAESSQLAPPQRLFGPVSLLILISLAVRIAWLLIRPTDAVAADTVRWKWAVDTLLAGQNPYLQTDVLNYPPLWMMALYAFGRLGQLTGLSFQSLLFSFLILADQIQLIALVALIRNLCPNRPWFFAVCVGFVLNPAVIFQSTQHGNFDVLLAIGLTMTCYFIVNFIRRGDAIDWLWACAFLGGATFCKTSALLALPIVMVGVGRLRVATLLLGGVLIATPATVGVGTLYVLAPAAVWKLVILYRSVPGFYGINGLLRMIKLILATRYSQLFPLILLGLLAATCRFIIRWRNVSAAELVLIAALLTLAVPAIGSGFGAQYVYWSVPLLIASYVALADLHWRAALITLAAIVAITYTFQYLTVASLGAAALQGQVLSSVQQRRFDFLGSPAGLTLVRLPMFIATLVVVFVGVRLLHKRRFAGVVA